MVRCLRYYLKFSNFAVSILIYRGIILLNIFFSKRDLAGLEGQTWEIRWFEHHGIRASRNIILTWGRAIYMKLGVKLATLLVIISVNFHYNPYINDGVSTNSTPRYQKRHFPQNDDFRALLARRGGVVDKNGLHHNHQHPKLYKICYFQGGLFFRLSSLG